MKKQTQDIQDILKELQENIIELTWRRISDINNATNQNIDEYLIIFISNGKYYVDNFDFYVWFHKKYKTNKKILLFPKKKINERLKKLNLNKETLDEIKKSLNELYPDFNFFKI